MRAFALLAYIACMRILPEQGRRVNALRVVVVVKMVC
jgi:hypothetical protein